jgi:hypothetical protein
MLNQAPPCGMEIFCPMAESITMIDVCMEVERGRCRLYIEYLEK